MNERIKELSTRLFETILEMNSIADDEGSSLYINIHSQLINASGSCPVNSIVTFITEQTKIEDLK